MERIRLTENFYLDEFVDPVTYFTDIDNGLARLDFNIVKCVQLLRTKAGHSININGWWKHLPEDVNGFDPVKFLNEMISKRVPVWSGFRSELCKIGASKSAHKLGKAVDPKGNQKEYYKIVEDNAQEFYALGLRRLEDISITNGWLHMDTEKRNCKPNSIRVIDRTKCTKTIYFA